VEIERLKEQVSLVSLVRAHGAEIWAKTYTASVRRRFDAGQDRIRRLTAERAFRPGFAPHCPPLSPEPSPL